MVSLLSATAWLSVVGCSDSKAVDATDATTGAIPSGMDANASASDAAYDSAPPDTGALDSGLDSAADATPDVADAADARPPVNLFDPALLPKFELTLDAAAVAVFSSTADADKKTWVHGTFKSGSTVISNVGVRRKGSSTFRALPQKVALKVKFDKYVAGQRFEGLTDLTLNNMTSDPTFLAERLAYHVFAMAGLPTLRANTAEVYINGENYGPYANLETPNEDLLARLYGARARSLYSVDHGSEWTGGADPGFGVEVGDGTRADLHLLFTDVAATRDPTLLAGVATHLDTAQFLRYCAAEAATGHYDGYAYGIYGSHNYYLAGDVGARFTLLPWSTDLTFSDREGVSNASNPLPADPVAPGATLLGRCKQSPTCWASYKAEVAKVLTVFEGLALEPLARSWHAQIDSLVRADPKREATIAYYDAQTALLYAWILARPGVVRGQLGLP